MKRQSLSRNFAYQFLYQILILVIPLVLSPYLTRTLHETALGVYTYANSIAYYFIMFSMLGISRHGQRVISQNCKDELSLRKTFWSLFYVHAIVSVMVLSAYIIFVCFFVKNYKSIYIIESFYVLSALFDITWFFYGIENFKSVVIKNAIVKIAECILIFLLIKSPKDLWIYTLICAAGVLIGQAVMLPQAMHMIKPVQVSIKDMTVHLKPLFVFSISVIAVSLYTVFDKILLGILTNADNVAFYEYANKIISIPKTVITVIGTVMFPRACKMVVLGDWKGQKRYIQYSFMLTSCIGMAALFGLLAIAKPFAILYYGESFAVTGRIMMAMSPLVYIIGTGDILRTQFLIPNHMDKQFNLCIMFNAIINIIVSVSLIPALGIFGVILGTVLAELFGILFQIIVCRQFVKVKEIIIPLLPFVVIGLVMFLVIRTMICIMDNSFISLIVQISVGGLIYLLLATVYIMTFYKEIRKKVIDRFSR
ncbi:oligosaccharide flippase family protein [Lachnospiraceae bacterium 62-26]